MEKFNMPIVVRQKGLIDDTLKVYVENRVIQYIKELKDKTQFGNRYAVLVGDVKKIEDEECLIIVGALKCNCRRIEDLDDYFMKQVKGYMQEQASKYFPDSKIMGIVSIDKENSGRDEQMVKSFKKMFINDYNMLFMQSKHSEELCYMLNGKVEGLKGYFVYYEKNEKMKEYTQENPIDIIYDSKEMETIEHRLNRDNGLLQNENFEINYQGVKRKNMKIGSFTNHKGLNGLKEQNVQNESGDNKETKELFNNVVDGRKAQKQIKGPSFVNVALFMLCIILGYGLMQNIELTRKLESKMKVMTSSNSIDIFNTKAEAKELNEDNKDNELGKQIEKTDNTNEIVNIEKNEKIMEETNEKINEEIKEESVPLNQSTEVMEKLANQNENMIVSQYQYYIVEKGDNLKGISRKFYGNESHVEKIKELNQIDNENYIKVGDVLKLYPND